MLSRVAAAGLRARVCARAHSGRQAWPFQPAVQNFHTSVSSRAESSEKNEPALGTGLAGSKTTLTPELGNALSLSPKAMARARELEADRKAPLFDSEWINKIIDLAKFDDPVRVTSYILLFSVPLIVQGVVVLDEELYLLGTFVFIYGTVGSYIAEPARKMLDDMRYSILAKCHEREEADIKHISGAIDAYKRRLHDAEDFEALMGMQKEAVSLEAQTAGLQMKHERRHVYARMLDVLKVNRSKRIAALRQREVDEAIKKVVAQMDADKKLKKAALDNALVALGDPSAASKVDPVSKAFAQYWKDKAAEMEKIKDKTYSLDDAQYEEEKAELKAALEKLGDFAPSGVLEPESKERKMSTASLFY